MKVYKPFFILLLLVLVSCGGSKKVVNESDVKLKTLKQLVGNYNKSQPKFTSLRGRLKGTINLPELQQGININYRYQNGETIWMSAKLAGLIQVAKLKITQENVQFYERIQQSYFDGDFSLISNFFGMDFNYDQIQNLLLGQTIRPIDILISDLESFGTDFQISTNFKDGLKQTVILDKNSFNIKRQNLSIDNRKMTIEYHSFNRIDGMAFPKELTVTAVEDNRQVSLTLTYKNININEDLKFPFKIPQNFSRIKI